MVKCRYCDKQIKDEEIIIGKSCFQDLVYKSGYNIMASHNDLVISQFGEILEILNELVIRMNKIESQLNLAKRLKV